MALSLSLPPIPMGAIIAGSLITLHVALQAILGFPSQSSEEATSAMRSAVVFALLIAYALTASRVASAATARDLRRIGARTEGPGMAGARTESDRHSTPMAVLRRGRIAGGLGVLMALGLIVTLSLQDPRVTPSSFLTSSFWRSEWLWAWLFVPLLFWIVGRGIYFQSQGVRQMSAAAREEIPIDLLDLRPAQVMGRMALRSSLIWILGLTLASLLFIEPGFLGTVSVLFMGGILAVGVATFLIPMRGIRDRLRAARRDELERLDAEIRVFRDRERTGQKSEPGRLADRLAYRQHIESLSEWPVDTATLTRFGLYLLIPLGSWLGGALMERLLGRLLD
jgi:hypothetical protein